jgi:hypothetical protein
VTGWGLGLLLNLGDDGSDKRSAGNSNEFQHLLGDSFPEVVRQLYSAAYRVLHSEPPNIAQRDELADASFRLFTGKPKEEQTKTLTRSVFHYSCRKFRAFINSLDSFQFLKQSATSLAQVPALCPFHSSRPTLPTLVQVPGGPLKTRIRIEYDDFLLCHAVTVPECLDQRNLSCRPG